MDKAKQVEEKDDVKYVPVKEEEIFGFNDPRYADMKLRLIVCHNDSPASTISETSECGGSDHDDDDTILHVSSLVLGKSSRYFRNILAGRSVSDSAEVVVFLAAQEVATFVVMIKSVYCCQLKVNTSADLMAVLRLANRFEVRPCLKLCCKMMRELTFETSVQIIDACEKSQQSEEVKELLSLASSFLCSHFQWTRTSSSWDSAKIEQWKTLSPHVLRLLLASDCLLISYEEKAFEMLQIWISANCKSCDDVENIERNRLLLEFGGFIRWPLMECFCLTKYLKKFNNKQSDHPLRPLIVEALLYRASRMIEDVVGKGIEEECGIGGRVKKRRGSQPVPVVFIRKDVPYERAITFFSVSVSELEEVACGEWCYSDRFWWVGCANAMRWKMMRSNSRVGGRRSRRRYVSQILLALEYLKVSPAEELHEEEEEEEEGDVGRPDVALYPHVALHVWHPSLKMYVAASQNCSGRFFTLHKMYIGESNDVASFRAELVDMT